MRVLKTETPALFAAAVEEATRLLKSGDVVAVPTETVYGLAANALDSASVRKIFEAKGRPSHNPLIVHVASFEMARECAKEWPGRADELARKFWPGPLTLVLNKSSIIPDEVTAGGSTVAIRWPSHPFMQAVIRRCGFPLAAPSANRSNELSPTNARHVTSGLGDRVKLVVDGGQCQVGIESTVFDVARGCVLRPGMISAAELLAGSTRLDEDNGGFLRSPGMLDKHYSPKARVIVGNIDEAARLPERGRIHVIAYHNIPLDAGFGGVSVIPDDAEAYARALYAELHRCDEAGFETIFVERPPDAPEWEGIRDRLRRASHVAGT